MRKLLIVLVGSTLACATAQKTAEPGKPAPDAAPAAGKAVPDADFPVVIAKSAIKVDADLSDWPDGLPVAKVASADGKHAASFRLFVDGARVYWAAEVVDPTPSVNRQPGGNNWDGEAVELLLGTHDDDRSGLRPGDVQLIVSYNPAAPLAWNYFAGKAPADAKVAVKDVAGGWLVEASFSLADLGLSAPAPGAPVWIDMALDNSNGGGRTAQYIWVGGGDFYRTPLMWKKTAFVAR